MPGRIITQTSALPTSFGSGRPGFSFQFMPSVVGEPGAPLLPPGAHWTNGANAMTRFFQTGMAHGPAHIQPVGDTAAAPAPQSPNPPAGSALAARQITPG
jgi:hypothetical protein